MASLNPRIYSSTKSMISSNRVGSASDIQADQYGRVIDIIMDSSHPKWKELGGSQALYGVFYQHLYKNNEVKDSNEDLNFAYCRQSSVRKLPIKNEIVSLVSDVRSDTTDEYGGIKSERLYWDEIIPVWNSPHLNAYPDVVRDGNGPVDTGKNFKETGKIKPLQLCDGDVSIEGRHGNTIRLGGTQGKGSPVSKNDTNGEPYILVRVGQEGSAGDTVSEDIDKDKASIYILSDHKAPLTQANDKRKAWKGGKGPTKASDYQGAQIVANANRIFINAREDDIELSAKGEVGLNGKLVALDGKDYVAFDADKIYLGKSAFYEIDPVLLGQQTVMWLQTLCNNLNTLLTTMGTTVSESQLAGLAATAQAIKPTIMMLGSDAKLKTLQSKKSFVE